MALLGFAAFGLVASATYIVNDLWDLPSDRGHWSRRYRPLASGDLSIREGIFFAICGLAGGFAAGSYAGKSALLMLALYTAGTLSYSFVGKRVPVFDVLVLASLFTLRLGFGIRARGCKAVALAPGLFDVHIRLAFDGQAAHGSAAPRGTRPRSHAGARLCASRRSPHIGHWARIDAGRGPDYGAVLDRGCLSSGLLCKPCRIVGRAADPLFCSSAGFG